MLGLSGWALVLWAGKVLDTGPRGLCILVPVAAAAAGLRLLAVYDLRGDAAPTAIWQDAEAGHAHVMHPSPRLERLQQLADQQPRGRPCSQLGRQFHRSPPRLESSQRRLAFQMMPWS